MALILLFLPGVLAALPLRVPWLVSLAIAPALSTTAVVLLSVISSAAGVPWGPVPLVVGILALWLVTAAIVAFLRRRTTPDERGPLPITAIVVTAVAAVAVGLVLLTVSRTPEAFPQSPDTLFHLGVAQWMVEHHDASFLHAEGFRRLSVSGAYQAAFHTMVATISQLSGASVVVSTSSFVLVIAGVVWPLGCVFLARTLFGPDPAVTISAAVASVAFAAYPYMLMGYGVLWPNLFGQTLLPAEVALLAVVTSATGGHPPPLKSRLRALMLLVVSAPVLLVAHPNAFLALLLFGSLMAAGIILARAWQMRRAHPRLPAASVAGLLVAIGLGFAASKVFVEAKGGKMPAASFLGPEVSPGEAVRDTLLFTQPGAKGLWVLAVLVVVGAVIVILRHPDSRWLVAALLIASTLFWLNVAVDNPTVRLVTWPWNNQSPRLAAVVVLPAILLATVAMATGARILTARGRLTPWPAAVLPPLLFTVVTGGGYLDAHRRALNPYFEPASPYSWVSSVELHALNDLAQHVPPDAVVAENPWNGGSYMYVVSGRYMLFPTETARTAGDRTLLAEKLDDVGTSAKVCAAARRQRVRFAIVGGQPWAGAGKRANQYAGVDTVNSSLAFRKVAKEGPYTLYKMVECADQGGASSKG